MNPLEATTHRSGAARRDGGGGDARPWRSPAAAPASAPPAAGPDGAAALRQPDRRPVIIAISGSLRRRSVNSAALRAAAAAATRSGMAATVDRSLRTLPPFDPDLEAPAPPEVERFRDVCARAGGLLIAVPEYAHGIPGAFKNALDWTVGAGSFHRKPVAVLSVSPPGRGGSVREALERVLAALGCDVSHHSVPIHPTELVDGEVRDGATLRGLLGVVEALAARAPGSDGAEHAVSAARDPRTGGRGGRSIGDGIRDAGPGTGREARPVRRTRLSPDRRPPTGHDVMTRLLAISGSLRPESMNRALLRAAAAAAPPDVEFVPWGSLGAIPAFDEDLVHVPASVALLKEEIGAAEGVLFATPEYNSSVPGALKNALDWVSRPLEGNPLRGKPVAVVGASTGSSGAIRAQDELRRVLRTLGAHVAEDGLAVARAHDAFTPEGRLRAPQQAAMLESVVDGLVRRTRRRAA